ncbi:DUF4259 domain-containing protein [Streptomyces niveus]|uniref:DUF4259 domain-containing protein n=1 Tax=Streptomyces niveus TaxID=193462 RepID=UPI003869C445
MRRSPDDHAGRAAADFGCDLDDAAMDEREAMIRAVLARAADSTDHLDMPEGERVVAAVALVAGQHPDGEPACPHYGPSEPLRTLRERFEVAPEHQAPA